MVALFVVVVGLYLSIDSLGPGVYLVRVLDTGAHVEYDPSLVVLHRHKSLSPSALQSIGARDGARSGA